MVMRWQLFPFDPKDRSTVANSFAKSFNPELYLRSKDFFGSKCSNIRTLTSYDYVLAQRLEGDSSVRLFKYRSISYRYFHPETRRTKEDYCHFQVVDVDWSTTLVYVCPEVRLHREVEIAKIEAVEMVADELGYHFSIVTELDLFGSNPEYMRSLIEYMYMDGWKFTPIEEVGDHESRRHLSAGDARLDG